MADKILTPIGAADPATSTSQQAGIGIGTTPPTTGLHIGATGKLRVDTNGNVTRINDIPYSWPAAQGAATQVLTNDGAGNLTWAAGSTLGGTIAATQLAFGASANTFAGSANLTWDDTTKTVTVSHSTLDASLATFTNPNTGSAASGTINVIAGDVATSLQTFSGLYPGAFARSTRLFGTQAMFFVADGPGTGKFEWHNGRTTMAGGSPSERRMSLLYDGSLIVGGGTATSTLLRVEGTSHTTGAVSMDTTLAVTGTATLGSLTVDTNTLFVDTVNNRVGIGTTGPTDKLQVYDTVGPVGIRAQVSTGTLTSSAGVLASSSSKTLQMLQYEDSTAGTMAGITLGALSAFWSNSTKALLINSSAAAPMVFATSDTERMRIAATGEVTMGGTLTATGVITPSAGIRFTNAAGQHFYIGQGPSTDSYGIYNVATATATPTITNSYIALPGSGQVPRLNASAGNSVQLGVNNGVIFTVAEATTSVVNTLTVSKTNTASADGTATSHLVLSNPVASEQTKIEFWGGSPLARRATIRADYVGGLTLSASQYDLLGGALNAAAINSAAITASGNITAAAAGSNTTTPRIVGLNGGGAGEAGRFQMLDANNVIQSAAGGPLSISSYHQTHINGGQGGALDFPATDSTKGMVYVTSPSITNPLFRVHMPASYGAGLNAISLATSANVTQWAVRTDGRIDHKTTTTYVSTGVPGAATTNIPAGEGWSVEDPAGNKLLAVSNVGYGISYGGFTVGNNGAGDLKVNGKVVLTGGANPLTISYLGAEQAAIGVGANNRITFNTNMGGMIVDTNLIVNYQGTFAGNPTGTTLATAGLYVNPPLAPAGSYLQSWADNGVNRMSISKGGQLVVSTDPTDTTSANASVKIVMPVAADDLDRAFSVFDDTESRFSIYTKGWLRWDNYGSTDFELGKTTDGTDDLQLRVASTQQILFNNTGDVDFRYGVRLDSTLRVTGVTQLNNEIKQKAHAAFAGSDVNTATVAVQTINTSATILKTWTLDDASVYWFEAKVIGRMGDGSQRAFYIRQVRAHREAAGSATLGTIQAPVTDESDVNWDVSFFGSGNDVLLLVTGGATAVNWVATIQWQKVSGNA